MAYTRGGNPTERPAEAVLTDLEGGADAMLFSSGMAAATAVFATLRPDDHVVIPTVLYYGVRDWLVRFCARWNVGLDTYDPGSEDSLRDAVREGRTQWVWVETPSNSTWAITDIAAAVAIAHDAGARVAVDNTVPTPLLTRPLELGADVVVHAATKFLNGHSDVLAGAAITRNADDAWEEMRWHREHAGAVLGPFEAWLLLRGMRTLGVRLERSCASAAAIAKALTTHPNVERVLYPGLPDHPGHAIAARQMGGRFGAMISLLVRGDAARAREVATRTRVFIPATSLGGVESLIEHRASVEGPDSPVPENLLRLSVGIESVDDLLGDLERALR
jgi:cystathionine gamma-synthase